ncbi:pentapeptide repeat-containing protein [Amycolatopsis sp. NPDC049252]|uniref:pentapeptide repeat-containing protein n=1 Tax=Amycolatopsis sp. NPDC049252 TaxID=3363933 RepID=UPI003723F5FB
MKPDAAMPTAQHLNKPGKWWAILLATIVPILALTALAISVLLATINVTEPRDLIELVKAGLGVGAGTGGAVALVLTGRRQWSVEHANRATEYDASERRATELYAKAAEQLGSDKAPIRMAGLYALERLAAFHPSQRQTVANLLCGYLRMPFDHSGKHQSANGMADEHQNTTDHRQEREVRLAAQAIFKTHLQLEHGEKGPDHWGRITIDLTGATLIDFDLYWCTVGYAKFIDATFVGRTEFCSTYFEEMAVFDGATFVGHASFYGTAFQGTASFRRTSFEDVAYFDKASFGDKTEFEQTNFAQDASFFKAEFVPWITFAPAGVEFTNARFARNADFSEIVSKTCVGFTATTFNQATFDGSSFDEGVYGLIPKGDPSKFTARGATSKQHPLSLPTQAEPDDYFKRTDINDPKSSEGQQE